ncbi:6-bladed beta-propeller [candidate division KSB1 bacterium]
MEVDDNKNVYVIDKYQNDIKIFNKEGMYLKTIGDGEGQGPRELDRPQYVKYYDNRLYIDQSQQAIKVWDLDGKYVTQIMGKDFRFSQARYSIFKDYYIVVEDNVGNGMRAWEMSRLDKEMNRLNFIAKIEHSQKSIFRFSDGLITAFNSKGNLFFPTERDKYIVNEFTPEGELVRSFGREYERKPYSDKFKTAFEKNEEEYRRLGITNRIKIEKHPPVVRRILVDDKDFIWIVVGECDMDNLYGMVDPLMDPPPLTIDIFSPDGVFLYTYSNPELLLTRPFIRNGRLYSYPPTSEKQDIDVYKIIYNY